MTDQPRSCESKKESPPSGLGEGGQPSRAELNMRVERFQHECHDKAMALAEAQERAEELETFVQTVIETNAQTGADGCDEALDYLGQKARALLKDGER